MMKLKTALAVAALSLGFAGSASAAPPIPCTAENQGTTYYQGGHNGGLLYLCLANEWELVARCDGPGDCTWY
ncbi:hypothetical protein QFW77_04345 [Luteimonas sp. RD2P54]|uniref:DUF333 domain-containing protein n=1 Tax=Luteimonas endophytica TaxID=3042023 RepID=A0ABT6J5Y2_9GAMM|nr:hypothetical protein [Luteimonas endophytica]MDH5822219.1 hypothetical protein [Luteimonas endophytica]